MRISSDVYPNVTAYLTVYDYTADFWRDECIKAQTENERLKSRLVLNEKKISALETNLSKATKKEEE
jgi:hypothetical protein